MLHLALPVWWTLVLNLLAYATFANPLFNILAHPSPRMTPEDMAFKVRSTPRCLTIELWYLSKTCLSVIPYSSSPPDSPSWLTTPGISVSSILTLLIERYVRYYHFYTDASLTCPHHWRYELTLVRPSATIFCSPGIYSITKRYSDRMNLQSTCLGIDELDRYTKFLRSVRTV